MNNKRYTCQRDNSLTLNKMYCIRQFHEVTYDKEKVILS